MMKEKRLFYPAMAESKYKAMWLITLFDLPTDTPSARKAYANFRKTLIESGFTMMQYSVYVRYCSGEDKANTQRKKIQSALPDDGEVRIISITDIQYSKIYNFVGKRRQPIEEPPKQIQLF